MELSGLPSFYDDAGLMELKDETFIFGVNGTGKSSIARKLKQQAVANGLSVALFDQRYIRDLIQQESIEGVFQIRDASEEVQKRLKELSGEQGTITRKRKYIEELERTQKEKNDITDKIKEEFEKNAWNIKRDCIAKYPEATALCFKRLNTREKFQKECLDRYKSMKNVDYEEPSDLEFEERAKSIKMDNPRIDAICSENVFNFQLSEEEKSVAQTQYRLCKDNPLSDLISQMNIDQWVKEGIQHLNNSESDVCPLCQQSLSDELKNNLEQLVNQDFDAAEKCLDSLTERLKKSERGCEEISKELGKLARFDTTELEKSLNKLRLEFKDLRDNVNEKKRNLQKSIVLAFNTDIRDECKDALYSLNKKNARYNEIIENRKKAEHSLVDDFWAFVIHRHVKDEAIKRESALEGPQKALENLDTKIEKNQGELKRLQEEYQSLLQHVTSSEPVVEEINDTLKDLNFRSFELCKLEERDMYCLVRENGLRVEAETLSEGEKTFIAFLYFYHSVEKKARDSSQTQHIIGIVDDPISSLDSMSLFAVSLLCRSLQEIVEDSSSMLEQIVFSTHNAYFFKEIAFFPPKRANSAERIFHVLSKDANAKSIHRRYESNPILSSYDQLWEEVRVAASDQGVASHSLQNSMRRILENYFRLTGGMSTDFTAGMNKGEALAANSLLSWMNDGSHNLPWQIDYSFDGTDAKTLVGVFRKIFEAANQVQHFEMMMGETGATELDYRD